MRAQRALSVLHIVPAVRPTNAQYHEHCLPLRYERKITVCSLLPATLTPPPSLELFAGDGSRRGAWRALQAALRGGPYDVIHAHVPVTGALLALAMLIGRQSRAACVFSLGNSYGSFRRRNKMLLYPVFVLFPHLVMVSAAVKESLPPILSWLARKATVAPNGVDIQRVEEVLQALDHNLAGGKPDGMPGDGQVAGLTVVSVGRLVDIKDPHTLLAAFASCAGTHDRLVFVGDGPLGGPLRRAADQAGISSQVEITGLIPRDEVYRQVVRGDVCVSVSLGEGLPVAVLESMACGRPVILSDIPPHREIADGDDDVIPLVATADVDGLVRELTRLRDMSPEQRSDTGRRCKKVVSERFDIAAMHRSLAPVYRRAARRNDWLGANA